MIVAHWENQETLVVHALASDFQGVHVWRWQALQELAATIVTDAWGQHVRMTFALEVELAVVLLLQPCWPRAQGPHGRPWILPSRRHAHEVLRLGRYPEPSPFFVAPAHRRISQADLDGSRREINHEIEEAELVFVEQNGDEHQFRGPRHSD